MVRPLVNPINTIEAKFQPPDFFSQSTLVDTSEEKLDKSKIPEKIVEDEKKFSCSTCDYKTVWKSALKSHERIIHKTDNILFTCRD